MLLILLSGCGRDERLVGRWRSETSEWVFADAENYVAYDLEGIVIGEGTYKFDDEYFYFVNKKLIVDGNPLEGRHLFSLSDSSFTFWRPGDAQYGLFKKQ